LSDSENKLKDEKETFEQLFFSFWQSLNLISKDPETQCKTMGNYNVAWELKDEVLDGQYLIPLPGKFLSDEQKLAIKQFLVELNKIPSDVLQEATSPEENILAMSNSCWRPIRKHASILLRILEPVKDNLSEEFKKYLDDSNK
jgi:hypothetical protein